MTSAGPYRWQGQDLCLELQVQPRAKKDAVAGRYGDRLRVRLAAPPVEGKANERLVRFLAEEFGVPQKAVQILAGQTGRSKSVVVRQPRKMPDWLGLSRAASNPTSEG